MTKVPPSSAETSMAPAWRWGLIALAVVVPVGAVYAFLRTGQARRADDLRGAERAATVREIASAVAADRSASGRADYSDISGVSADGSIASLFPEKHRADESISAAGSCPSGSTNRACEAFRNLRVRFDVPLWFRYGGTAGRGSEAAAKILGRFGLPPPSGALGATGPWFIVVAAPPDADDGEWYVYTSWDNTQRIARPGRR